jgi:hypothetical protein
MQRPEVPSVQARRPAVPPVLAPAAMRALARALSGRREPGPRR